MCGLWHGMTQRNTMRGVPNVCTHVHVVPSSQLTHFSQTINLDIARRQLSANVLATKMDGMATLEACIKDASRTEQQIQLARSEIQHISADAMAT